jgi:hypothetical protein
LLAIGVGGEHSVYEHRRVDLEGHVVDGLAVDARGLGDLRKVGEDSARRSSSMIMAIIPKATFSPCQ